VNDVAIITTFDLVAGTVAALALGYLLVSEQVIVHYVRFFRITTFGLLVFAVTGPLVGLFAPAFVHVVHGIAVLFVSIALFGLVRDELDREMAFYPTDDATFEEATDDAIDD